MSKYLKAVSYGGVVDWMCYKFLFDALLWSIGLRKATPSIMIIISVMLSFVIFVSCAGNATFRRTDGEPSNHPSSQSDGMASTPTEKEFQWNVCVRNANVETLVC